MKHFISLLLNHQMYHFFKNEDTKMKIGIKDLVGENCITLDDGTNIYKRIHPELLADRSVELDFTGVSVFASPFFNAAIGQLLKDNSSEKLNRLLKITNLTSAGVTVIRRVIENAKQYYSDPKIKQAIDDVLNEHLEEK